MKYTAEPTKRVEMESPSDLIMDPETGYYFYPVRPEGIHECESMYPREYTLKTFSVEDINTYNYESSIRGYSISRQSKGDINVRLEDGSIKTIRGWIPGISGLAFRNLALGFYNDDGWHVVERNTGISLMPVQETKTKDTDQLSFDFASEPIEPKKILGKSRPEAVQLAMNNVKTFTDEQWIEIYEQLDYDLAGIEYTPIKTPEQERLEKEWGAKFEAVYTRNRQIMKTKNFLHFYSKLRVHENTPVKLKMVKHSEVFKLAEKVDSKVKTKFYFDQNDYGTAIELEGIVLPIEIEGLPEMKELVIVKGDQFKGSILKDAYTATRYYVHEPYTGIAMISKLHAVTNLKKTIENIVTYLSIRLKPGGIKKVNLQLKEHREKIIAAKEGQDITRFLEQE